MSHQNTRPGYVVVGSRLGIGVLDLLFRRRCGMPFSVAVPNGIAGAEHDVICAGATVDGLVEVVVHGEFIGKFTEIGGIAVVHVIEPHRR